MADLTEVDCVTRGKDGKKFIGIPDFIKCLQNDKIGFESNGVIINYIDNLIKRLNELMV